MPLNKLYVFDRKIWYEKITHPGKARQLAPTLTCVEKEKGNSLPLLRAG